MLSVVGEQDAPDPEKKGYYSVRVGKGGPEKITALLKQRGIFSSAT
jgi:hypothetical protein